MMPLNVPKPDPYALMRNAIQARAIRRGTDWEYLSEADRRVLSATALEAGDDEWLNEAGELRDALARILDGGDISAILDLIETAITIAHHSGRYLYEDTWPRMDSEAFTK